MVRELLRNGTLGGSFLPHREEKKLLTAAAWHPWWLSASEDAPDWKFRQPAFLPATLDDRFVQQVSTPWAAHVAGLWQQVPAAVGNRYEFTAEGQAWSSEDVAPASQLEACDVNLQLGIDPTGGTDPESPLIIWGERLQPLSHWQTLHVTAVAEAAILTVFLKSAPNLPRRQQSVFWRNAFLRPVGRHKRALHIVGMGDTHIDLTPEQPQPGETVEIQLSSLREIVRGEIFVLAPDGRETAVSPQGNTQDNGRFQQRYVFETGADGLYDIRFVSDHGARLLALRLLRVTRDVQLVPRSATERDYQRVYLLLPPTANEKWLLAAARGSFLRRFTIGFSADDAGMGDFEQRHVLAINPHHWPTVLTEGWFEQYYPGVKFTAVIANKPADLEAWLEEWEIGD